ncbi:MAG: leucine-rich repeat domain-containing protein [Candidatus Aphodosoma sp.]
MNYPTISKTEITDEEREEAIYDEYGAKYTKDWLKLIEGPENLTSYTVKEGTKIIGNTAFWCRNIIKSIILPNSVTSIGDLAFCDCTHLYSINILNGVTSIGEEALDNCSALESITIPQSVKNIEHGIFNQCN